jgi:TolA-binding protein
MVSGYLPLVRSRDTEGETMKKIILMPVIVILTASTAANAEIYKCEEKGKVTFSQVPCSANAEKITVRETSAIKSDLDVEAINNRVGRRIADEKEARRQRMNADIEARRHRENVAAQREIAKAQREQARAIRSLGR